MVPGQNVSGPKNLADIVNLALYHQAMVSKRAPEFASRLVSQGGQASLDIKSGQDEWLISLDPCLVVPCKPVALSSDPSDLEKPSLQMYLLKDCFPTNTPFP